MTLYDLYKSCVAPRETIIIWDEDSSTLYDFDEFIQECYKKNIPFALLHDVKVSNLCVNGECIQCEVNFDE